MKRKKPNATEQSDCELQSYAIAACILILILTRGNLNGFSAFHLHKGSIIPVFRKDEWFKLSPSEKQELDNQILESYQMGSLVALGLVNKMELFGKILADLDSSVRNVILGFLFLCQTQYLHFIKGVMTHWYNNEKIWREDFIGLFPEDKDSAK